MPDNVAVWIENAQRRDGHIWQAFLPASLTQKRGRLENRGSGRVLIVENGWGPHAGSSLQDHTSSG